jgi:hypothetical protein
MFFLHYLLVYGKKLCAKEFTITEKIFHKEWCVTIIHNLTFAVFFPDPPSSFLYIL